MPAATTTPRCSIARTLEILGERWTLLVVREAFFGATRFSEFRATLGVASDVLTTRLATLVDHGVMEKLSYRDEGSRERFSYHLTASGRDLHTVLAALKEWGDEYRPLETGLASEFRRTDDGSPVHLAFVDENGAMLERADVELVRRQPVPMP
jgi:DNA-binding HxlR family transcriptional regulator